MRVVGYVLLVIGIAFLVLFAFAAMGGAHLGFVPWFVSIFLIAMGWTFARSGTGIVRVGPAAVAATATDGPLTMELPISPEAAAVIRKRSEDSRRIPLYIGGAFLVLFVAIGATAAALDKTPGEGSSLFGIFAIIGIVSAAMIIGICWLATRSIVRDARGATYLRTTGPIQVVPMMFGGGAVLRLADRAFLMNSIKEIRALSKLDRGTVDYSPHGHVILAARDSQGQIAYCAPGYTSE